MADSGAQGRGLLAGIRVIDIATERAELAGRLFADLGAEVIKIEPPGGSPSRRIGPFAAGREGDTEASLYWASVALGKRSVVVDIETAAGREELRVLLATADVFVESFDPGHLGAVGLGYDDVHTLNPALVYVSVTPYGQTGPDALSPASDLTLEAAGGLVGLQGDGDRPPIPVGYPQASFHAGAQAAADAIVALNARAASGLGQHLDVSMQACMVWTLMSATGFPTMTGANPPAHCEKRNGPRPDNAPGVTLPVLIPCADGTLMSSMRLGVLGMRTLDRVVRWMEEEGAFTHADLVGRDWRNWMPEVTDGLFPAERMSAVVTDIVAFLGTKTMREVHARALRDDLLIAPFFRIPDLVEDPQLAARDYWTEVDGRLHPGPFIKLSETPVVLRPAPRLGEAAGRISLRKEHRPAQPGATPAARKQPFTGLKVADFAWVGVGPIMSRALADHGATVVHIETALKPDVLRTLIPFKDGVPGLNRSQFVANFNASKLGLALNFAEERGRELARRVIKWADVVVESFTPGTMERAGLDYATLSEHRDDLVMLSTCLRGQTGPERHYAGFGGQGAGLSGLAAITGWPDRVPVGPWGAYTDFVAPRYGLAALAAALLDRRRTGRGQYIDLSQVEAAMHFIEPLILDYTVNGRVATARGLDSERACPHGTFRCLGVERYVAVTVETPAEWRGLRQMVPLDLFAEPGLDDLACRLAHRESIEQALGAWCADKDAWAVADRLKRAGVPAAPVLFPADLYADRQLAHRGFFITLDHSEMGRTPYDGFATDFSETPGRMTKAAPCLGEDTFEVLRDLIGLSDEEIADYAAAGVLT